jgi:hypothetical protein
VEKMASLSLEVPNHESPSMTESTICWLKTGCLGVRFVSLSPERKSELQEWLARKLEEGLPESIALQFQKTENSFLTVLTIEYRIEKVSTVILARNRQGYPPLVGKRNRNVVLDECTTCVFTLTMKFG